MMEEGIMRNFLQLLGIMLVLVITIVSSPSRSLADKFTNTFLIYYIDSIKETELIKIAKFDVLVVIRNNFDDIQGGTWKALKQINPDIQIYLYQMGPEVSDKQDNFEAISLNNVSRFDRPRGTNGKTLNKDFPDYFLKDLSGKRIRVREFDKNYVLDFGSSGLQKFWIEATRQDIINRPWKADGIFVDGCMVHSGIYRPHGVTSKKYPTATSWNNAMNSFVLAVHDALKRSGQRMMPNRGHSRLEEGYKAWLNLDEGASPPEIVLEEAAFAIRYGDSDVQFFSEQDWKRQIDLGYQIKKSSIAWLASTDLAINGVGVDNWGRRVTFWQAFWYAMCSYHLAKNETNTTYFMFHGSPHKKIWWFDEYDKIDLGAPLGKYKITSINGTNVYWREFEKGYIYVNPTNEYVHDVQLPEPCTQLTHYSLYHTVSALSGTTKFNLPAHHGAIFLKDKSQRQEFDPPPAAPTGLEVIY